jgi:hypothetical protein
MQYKLQPTIQKANFWKDEMRNPKERHELRGK